VIDRARDIARRIMIRRPGRDGIDDEGEGITVARLARDLVDVLIELVPIDIEQGAENCEVVGSVLR